MLEQNHATMAQFEQMLKANGHDHREISRAGKKKTSSETGSWSGCSQSKVLITDQQVEAYLNGESGESAVTTQKVRLGLILLPVDDKTGNARRG